MQLAVAATVRSLAAAASVSRRAPSLSARSPLFVHHSLQACLNPLPADAKQQRGAGRAGGAGGGRGGPRQAGRGWRASGPASAGASRRSAALDAAPATPPQRHRPHATPQCPLAVQTTRRATTLRRGAAARSAEPPPQPPDSPNARRAAPGRGLGHSQQVSRGAPLGGGPGGARLVEPCSASRCGPARNSCCHRHHRGCRTSDGAGRRRVPSAAVGRGVGARVVAVQVSRRCSLVCWPPPGVEGRREDTSLAKAWQCVAAWWHRGSADGMMLGLLRVSPFGGALCGASTWLPRNRGLARRKCQTTGMPRECHR